MNDQDWQHILEVVKTRLKEVDRGDLADEGRYEVGDETNGQSRLYLLVNAMLKELLCEMYAGSSSLVRRSIKNIEDVIENERAITEAVVHNYSDNDDSSDYDLVKGKDDILVSSLRKLVFELKQSKSKETQDDLE